MGDFNKKYEVNKIIMQLFCHKSLSISLISWILFNLQISCSIKLHIFSTIHVSCLKVSYLRAIIHVQDPTVKKKKC